MERYIDLHGHRTWLLDDERDAPTLLLVHGGLMGSERTFAALRPHLEGHFRLVMFDRRGHGRTADTSDPFHYEAMAEDVALVIEQLELAPVDAFGYSDGANALIELSRRSGDILKRQVLLSGNFHYSPIYREALARLESRRTVDNNLLAEWYAETSPDGLNHWPVIVDKILAMARREPELKAEDLASIATPTLVMAGDDDMWPLSHTVELFEALPNAQLAIIPGTSHMVGFEQPALVAQLVRKYLAEPPTPNTMMPMRRQQSTGN